jgi:hypothetical protein
VSCRLGGDILFIWASEAPLVFLSVGATRFISVGIVFEAIKSIFLKELITAKGL